MAPIPSTIPELVCPTPKSSSDPIFLSGATWITRSCVPSRLPSPDPSDLVAPSCPTIPLILPPSPSASPVQDPPPPPPPAPTLLTLPPEILLNILWFCSHPDPNLYRLKHDKVYIDRIRRGHPDLPIGTCKAVYASCRFLRNFLLDLECRGAGLRITDISGIRNWNLSPPIWAYSKDISVRWDDSGMTTWPWGVEEEQWTIIKSRSESKYGPQEPQEEPPQPPPLRADLVNKTGEKPKDPIAYMRECRRYLVRPPPPPPPPKKHREWIVEDLSVLLRGCESLISLDLNFPGALEALSVVVMGLPDSASIFRSVKTLKLRNGNERCLPTPKKLFVAIARFRGLVEVTVDGSCHGMRSLFSVKERKKRGVFVGQMEVGGGSQDKAGVLQGLWGWECEALEMPEKPVELERCIIRGLPGLGEVDSEGMSSGVWSSERGWPEEVRRELVHGGLVDFVNEVNVGKGDSDSSDDEIIAAVKVNVLTETREVVN